ncbi:GNAT family N-acetyltransferase [Photobacterium sanguinicancri]|uniref:GNAT family protein n=1 Tax=Photobacterium sanguinicancri TaxID=875932 RepID=A0AAW7YBS3_9GAMM|nr:GNAT family protein [Photobacterium sanguinicancri]KXI20961.1 GCN5 family acetyltransferase [Photobacterium sanguinicancri]MDO6544723.1 GNAT family protein [Photobacterium sanguinicancri]
MKLRTFDQQDYHQLIQWIVSAEINYMWGGPAFTYPLDTEQIHIHCQQSQIFPFLFTCSDSKLGYVELYQESCDHFRICRVFIAGEHRGQGLAKQMLLQLIDKAVNTFNAKQVSLAVFDHNHAAKACYFSLGFEVSSTEKGLRSFNGEPWDLILMEKYL